MRGCPMSYMDHITRCNTCAIRHKAVCNALGPEEIAAINRIAHRRTIAAGQTFLGEGETTSFFANIVSGVVKLTKSLEDGRQHIIGLMFPSDFVGRAFRTDTPFFAEAATDVELCVFPSRNFERLLAQYPRLEHRLFELTLSELDACREWMLLLARKSAAEKVASFLLMIARRVPSIGCSHSEDHDQIRFLLPLSRADMADCLGLTIETVSRQITKLRTRGIIELVSNREIVVLDMHRLEEAAMAGHAIES